MSSAETTASTTVNCKSCTSAAANSTNNNNNHNSINHNGDDQLLDGLRQEVTRLKCDKLDLLRQNVVCKSSFRANLPGFNLFHLLQNCQRDIKRLRERELSLQGDLAAAGKEILRLRELMKDYAPASAARDS